MTMKLDRTKPFGKISGDLFVPDGCDRAARYEQGGKFFDVHDRLIEPGVKVSIVPTEDDGPAEDDAAGAGMSVAELLRQADSMHWRSLKKAAAVVLGPECPASKMQIIEALQAAQRGFDERAGRRKTVHVAGEQITTERPSGLSKTGVDLAAWGRGQKEYLWGEVRKAIKTEFGRNVSERDDAVEFLIGEGILTSEEAREDVIREA